MTLVNLNVLWLVKMGLWTCGFFHTQNSLLALIPMSPLPSAIALVPSSASLIGLTSRVKGQGLWQFLRLDNSLIATWNKSVASSEDCPWQPPLLMVKQYTGGKGLWVNPKWDPSTCALTLTIHTALFMSTVQRTTTHPASPPAHLPQPHVWLTVGSGEGEGSHENKWVRGWLRVNTGLSLWAHISRCLLLQTCSFYWPRSRQRLSLWLWLDKIKTMWMVEHNHKVMFIRPLG